METRGAGTKFKFSLAQNKWSVEEEVIKKLLSGKAVMRRSLLNC